MIAPLLPPDYAGGGAQAIALGEKLIDLGINVVGLSGTNRRGHSKVYVEDLGSIRTYRVYRDDASGTFGNIVYFLRFFMTLFKLSIHSDILHFHGIRLYPMLGIPIAKLLRKKTIGKISLMGTDDPVSLSKGFIGRLRLMLFRKLDKWIALTDEAQSACIAVGIPKEKIARITNGVQCEKYKPSDSKYEFRQQRGLANKLIVLFAGIISYRKGVDLLIEVIPTLLRKYSNLLFIFVGPSSSSENPQVDDNLVKRLRGVSEDRIIITGFIVDPIDFIRSADIFVLPSRKEGLSNALLEAMSSGLPIVVSNHIWLSDVGDAGNHFLSFKIGNAEDLMNNLSILIESSETRSRLSHSARERIEKAFCLEKIAEKYSSLYSELEKEHGKDEI